VAIKELGIKELKTKKRQEVKAKRVSIVEGATTGKKQQQAEGKEE
jgi:hypothetical protein